MTGILKKTVTFVAFGFIILILCVGFRLWGFYNKYFSSENKELIKTEFITKLPKGFRIEMASSTLPGAHTVLLSDAEGNRTIFIDRSIAVELSDNSIVVLSDNSIEDCVSGFRDSYGEKSKIKSKGFINIGGFNYPYVLGSFFEDMDKVNACYVFFTKQEKVPSKTIYAYFITVEDKKAEIDKAFISQILTNIKAIGEKGTANSQGSNATLNLVE